MLKAPSICNLSLPAPPIYLFFSGSVSVFAQKDKSWLVN